MTSSLDLIRGRQVVQTLTNQSGGSVIAGDVVIIDTAHDESFVTTTTAAYTASQVCIALDTIAAAATGRVLLQGYAPLVNVSASATRGYYLYTHTVAKQATSGATFVAGAFGQVLKAGTTPSAYIFPPAIGSTAGITRSGSTTGDHLAVWNGSNADSIKDGGAVPSAGVTDGTWTDYSGTSTIVGWASFTIKEINYKKHGKLVFVQYYLAGVSNNATTSFTTPSSLPAGEDIEITIRVQDNGVIQAADGLMTLYASTNSVIFYKTTTSGAFTATGNKTVSGQFWYVEA